MLQVTQPTKRPRIIAATKELVAAHRFHEQNRAAPQKANRLGQSRLFCQFRLPRPAEKLRTARRTRNRFSMATPIRYVAVLARAIVAKSKARHRRPLAVIRKIFHNRVARPARRAREKRIATVTVGGIKKLAAAIVAQPDISRKDRRARRPAAFDRAKIRKADGQSLLHPKRFDRNRRLCFFEFLRERQNLIARPFDKNFHDAARIHHGAAKPRSPRPARDKRAKPHALHAPRHPNAKCRHRLPFFCPLGKPFPKFFSLYHGRRRNPAAPASFPHTKKQPSPKRKLLFDVPCKDHSSSISRPHMMAGMSSFGCVKLMSPRSIGAMTLSMTIGSYPLIQKIIL